MRDDIKINDKAESIEEPLLDVLETVMDPEIELDIYNLGLVYEINLENNGNLHIIMTFTGMDCTCIGSVSNDLKTKLPKLNEINDVSVDIVWSPAWNMTRISRIGRMTLGISPR